ncbi:MAG: DNA/RNA non-specific endonuclease [Bacteroidota bacterium]
MKFSLSLLAIFCVFTFTYVSCKKDNTVSQNSINSELNTNNSPFNKSVTNFPETFELASKTTYTTANATFSTGSWNLNDALIGTSSTDRKSGTKSVRVQNTGILSMNFDIISGVSAVSFNYGKYSTEANSTFELWASTNSGTSWVKLGSTLTASSTTLTKATFTSTYTGSVRFQIRKLTGGKLNVDDFDIQDIPSGPTRDDNMGMGNPTNATTTTSTPNNYLMVKSQYTMAYNNSKGEANWVSWHLSPAWKGAAARCDCFASDNTLPTGFYIAPSTSYSLTGFDRGHICPSEDRDSTTVDNTATFLMTNMIPQSPNLNRVTWVALENYCRTLMNAGNELYIISGGYGSGGTGSNGGVTTTIASGSINVPSHCWKVIVVLPTGSNDASRVSNTTRIIAVDMPNTQTVNAQSWGTYRVSVDALETILGYDFLNVVSPAIQTIIEAAADNGPTS